MSAKKRLGSDPFSSKAVDAKETQQAQSRQAESGELKDAASDESSPEPEEELAWLEASPEPAETPAECQSQETPAGDAGTLPAQQVLEGLSTGACLIAPDKRMLYVNQAMAELLQCQPEKLLGLDWERDVLRPAERLEPPSWDAVLEARQAMFFKTRAGVCKGEPMEVEVRCWLLSSGGSDETCICALMSKPLRPTPIPGPEKADISAQLDAKLPEPFAAVMASPQPEPETVTIMSWLFDKSPQLQSGEDLDAQAMAQVLENCSALLQNGGGEEQAKLKARVEVESLSSEKMLLMSAGLLGLLSNGQSAESRGGGLVEALVDQDHRGQPRLRVIDHGNALHAKLKLRAGKKSALSWLTNAVTNQGGSLLKVRGGQIEYRLTLTA